MNAIRWESINNTHYHISDDGRIMNMKKGNILRPDVHRKGYLRVTLFGKHKFIHRLVAIQYIPNPHSKPEVNHIDGNKTNNHYTNLEWSTSEENNLHAIQIGLYKTRAVKGENHFRAKLSNEDVSAIKKLKGNDRAMNVANMYNITKICVYKIWDGSRWGHIKAV